ncbi:MAG: TIGR00730 family Rossman fold protein [Acidimicrobiia bacterium]
MLRSSKYRTGDPVLDEMVADLVTKANTVENNDLIYEMIISALRLTRDHANRGDLKIANAALKEMRYAFHVFSPYRTARKVSIFGSARTKTHDPLYEQARCFAEQMASHDWMVITGAGAGIMAAGIEGAGPEMSFGVGIKLPFEATTTEFIADDPKLVNFRYFFTRKLSFMKESHGFVLLPGGFGTMDEAFELLTLVQTGKNLPAPIVLLDVPGGTYWDRWRDFVNAELEAYGYILPEDLALVKITDSIDEAVNEILGFYRNYHSQRFVDGRLVLRMHREPDAAQLATFNEEFADIITRGQIELTAASSAELADNDHPDLARLAFRFDRRHWARLRQLIDRLNDRPSNYPQT